MFESFLALLRLFSLVIRRPKKAFQRARHMIEADSMHIRRIADVFSIDVNRPFWLHNGLRKRSLVVNSGQEFRQTHYALPNISPEVQADLS